jgi:hypothetical protein
MDKMHFYAHVYFTYCRLLCKMNPLIQYTVNFTKDSLVLWRVSYSDIIDSIATDNI